LSSHYTLAPRFTGSDFRLPPTAFAMFRDTRHELNFQKSQRSIRWGSALVVAPGRSSQCPIIEMTRECRAPRSCMTSRETGANSHRVIHATSTSNRVIVRVRCLMTRQKSVATLESERIWNSRMDSTLDSRPTRPILVSASPRTYIHRYIDACPVDQRQYGRYDVTFPFQRKVEREIFRGYRDSSCDQTWPLFFRDIIKDITPYGSTYERHEKRIDIARLRFRIPYAATPLITF